MAERNPQAPHCMQSLLYVERNGNYYGYKPELIIDTICAEWGIFLVCSQCKGISRRARNVGGKTTCEMCIVGYNKANLDSRVVGIVASLTAKCPLWEKSCVWKGKLGKIERHMLVCPKVLITCELKCGIAFERETTEQHNTQICPLRMKTCEYCKMQVQANRENQHRRKCTSHPESEVPCPYKELGCEEIVLRKNRDKHVKENLIGHQKLILDQVNQLRKRNEQLENQTMQQNRLNERQKEMNETQRNRLNTMETSATDRSREHRGQWERLTVQVKKVKQKGKVCFILPIIAFVITVVICIVAIGLEFRSIQVNVQIIESNSKQIQTNTASVQSLRASLGYLHEYIEERGKVLPGIEWVHELTKEGTLFGPTFYLEQCKLRVEAEVSVPISDARVASIDMAFEGYNVAYLVRRLEGKYDSIIDSCALNYTYATFGYLDEIQPKYTYSYPNESNLQVGDSVQISGTFPVEQGKKRIVRAYFDSEEQSVENRKLN